jgi:glycogen operon protein
MLSQGVPMLVAGDEAGRSQLGNNNAYCQDTPLSWVDWALDESRTQLLEFARRVIGLRRAHPVFHRKYFFQGRPVSGAAKDIAWLKPDGTEMAEQEWEHDFARCLGVYLGGDALDEIDERGRAVVDDSFVVLFNAHHDPIPFVLPAMGLGAWQKLFDTADAGDAEPSDVHQAGASYSLTGRSLVLFKSVKAN